MFGYLTKIFSWVAVATVMVALPCIGAAVGPAVMKAAAVAIGAGVDAVAAAQAVGLIAGVLAGGVADLFIGGKFMRSQGNWDSELALSQQRIRECQQELAQAREGLQQLAVLRQRLDTETAALAAITLAKDAQSERVQSLETEHHEKLELIQQLTRRVADLEAQLFVEGDNSLSHNSSNTSSDESLVESSDEGSVEENGNLSDSRLRRRR